jgi:hypothetical protein
LAVAANRRNVGDAVGSADRGCATIQVLLINITLVLLETDDVT